MKFYFEIEVDVGPEDWEKIEQIKKNLSASLIRWKGVTEVSAQSERDKAFEREMYPNDRPR